MKNITYFFIKNFKLTIVLIVFVLVLGIQGIKKMNAESWPAVDFATATITTRYKGASPEDIEALITKPIEDEIRKVSGLKDVKSVSRIGESEIVVRVDMDRVDVRMVMDDVQKAVQKVTKLPSDLQQQPEFVEMKSSEFPAIEIAVVGSGEKRFRDAVAEQLKEEIEDIQDVKDVRAVGLRNREFTVELDLRKLKDLNIGVGEILNKISARNISTPGGDMEDVTERKLVRVDAKVKSAEELGNIVVRSNFTGQVIRIRDVASVIDGAEEPTVKSSWNGQEAVLLVVNKKAGRDTIRLADRVYAIVQRYQKTYQGKIHFAVYNNESNRVRSKLKTLKSNAASGMVIVLSALLIFMPGWVGIMASFSLPLSILTTLGIMPFFGMNLDSISILALIISMGMLVDNSIVITDNFVRLRREGKTSLEAILETISSLWAPITATAMTTIAAFLPMLVTKGLMGKFILSIPIVVTIALLVSLFESFLLLPVRLNLVGKTVKQVSEGGKDWFSKYRIRFESFMKMAIHYRYLTVAVLTAMIVGALILMAYGNKFMLFPAEQTEIYLARFQAPIGTPLDETQRRLMKLSSRILEAGGDQIREVVARAGTSVGRPGDPKGGQGANQGLVTIYASEFAKMNIQYTEFLKNLRDKVETSDLGKVVFEEMVNGPPVGSAIEATFRSNDSVKMEKVLSSVIEHLSKIPGILDLKIEDVVDSDELMVNIDYSLVDRLGISVTDIGTTVRTAFGGIFISDVTLNNKEVKLNVKFKADDHRSIEDLKQLRVMDRQGNLVELSKLAQFELKPGTPQIKRYDYKRARTLTGSVDGLQMTSARANAILIDYWKDLQLEYPEVSMVFGGEAENTKESMQSLFEAMILAFIGIFGLLVFMFRSFLSPFIIMMTIPLGLIGFSISFFLHGRPISFMALVGIIGLAGIIVNSGIVLIDFIQSMEKEGKMPLEEILVKASGERLRAVVTTSITTVAGLFPTAYGLGGKDAMLIPMTMAMAWGLTTGTIFTLIFIPPAYAILHDWIRFLSRLKFLKFFFIRETEAKLS
jgi:multidrug efflux pump subunit AcrB